MMEKLGVPQTHLCLKEMIKEVDEDFDGKISFREVQTNALCVIIYYYNSYMIRYDTIEEICIHSSPVTLDFIAQVSKSFL